MVILAFLLGSAFGISMTSLWLLVEKIKKSGMTEALLVDMLHEIASMLFVMILLMTYFTLD